MDYDTPPKNLAETLAEVLPKAALIHNEPTGIPGLTIAQVALPSSSKLQEVRIDLEPLLANPRQTKAKASFTDAASFLAYVKRHANEGTVTWCNFDPQSFALQFSAVIDEHVKGTAGWRAHRASFEPQMSAEWKAWKTHDRKSFEQIPFAEWIQEHEDDITTANGLPTSLQMLEMATDFKLNEERVLKSTARLQSGGVRLTYIADPDKGTTEEMKLFERFALGIPVFHGGEPWAITARLKYRNHAGKVSFFYELVRPDRVHEGAAKELIKTISEGLGDVPLLMGACS
jgi:uncharacterized protein YfdQ (DUF2303 family)